MALCMDKRTKDLLREAGGDLRASHDDEVIEAVIDDVKKSDSDSAAVTADLLKLMTEVEE